eukprot:1148772-Pelagomonas_calceolata.AAC.2
MALCSRPLNTLEYLYTEAQDNSRGQCLVNKPLSTLGVPVHKSTRITVDWSTQCEQHRGSSPGQYSVKVERVRGLTRASCAAGPRARWGVPVRKAQGYQ